MSLLSSILDYKALLTIIDGIKGFSLTTASVYDIYSDLYYLISEGMLFLRYYFLTERLLALDFRKLLEAISNLYVLLSASVLSERTYIGAYSGKYEDVSVVDGM